MPLPATPTLPRPLPVGITHAKMPGYFMLSKATSIVSCSIQDANTSYWADESTPLRFLPIIEATPRASTKKFDVNSPSEVFTIYRDPSCKKERTEHFTRISAPRLCA